MVVSDRLPRRVGKAGCSSQVINEPTELGVKWGVVCPDLVMLFFVEGADLKNVLRSLLFCCGCEDHQTREHVIQQCPPSVRRMAESVTLNNLIKDLSRDKSSSDASFYKKDQQSISPSITLLKNKHARTELEERAQLDWFRSSEH